MLIIHLTSGFMFTNHSQEHFFSPQELASLKVTQILICCPIGYVLLLLSTSKYRKIWPTRLKKFSRMYGKYVSRLIFQQIFL